MSLLLSLIITSAGTFCVQSVQSVFYVYLDCKELHICFLLDCLDLLDLLLCWFLTSCFVDCLLAWFSTCCVVEWLIDFTPLIQLNDWIWLVDFTPQDKLNDWLLLHLRISCMINCFYISGSVEWLNGFTAQDQLNEWLLIHLWISWMIGWFYTSG